MNTNSESASSVNFTLDPFDELDEDDDILAQAYDESIRLDTNGMIPGPSYVKPANQSFGNRPVESTSGFDYDSGKTWIYPLNYPLRQYQYAIVEQALYKNTLVSLPTGLGKTFIAAVVMYNFYRWYPRCKVVFMAPTKPLVAQQVEACFNVVGIPQEDISQMTGSMAPDARIQEWKEKRLFFLTPQVLTNDFARGACPAELIKCLVLDEAHRALGNHAYCQVMRELRERRCEFRVLALSATPGSDIAAVKQVLTNLLISHIELRSEDSPDITPYSHHRNIEKIVVPLGEELTNTKNRFLNILRVYVDRLLELRVLFTKDATTLSKFQLLQARDAFRQNPPENLPRHRFGAVEGLFALCVTLYHAFDLMLLHGARSSYKFLKGTLGGDKGKSFARAELLRNDVFRRLMDDLSKKFEVDTNQSKEASVNCSSVFPQTSSTSPMKNTKESYMMSHPKMSHLCDLVVDHHQKFASEGKSTRIMIFSQYRDSVLEITEMLHHHEPLVKAMSFVGQGTVARGSRGISQKEQLRVVKQFKEGGFNTLVSTCVGEEGLDIGDVDLIICYDAPKSPIRLVQRMGRTGRKREGRIVVLITKGKEEQMYNASQYQKRTINIALANKEKLNHFLYNHCPKMIPAGISPTCQKLHMKVDEWKVPTKRGRKKALSSNSTLKFPSHSSSTHKEKHGFLSEEEWNWYRDNLWVPREDFKAIPKPSFLCLDSEEEDGNFIDLGLYQPWHNSLQQAHHIGHSSRSNHLVQLTEFVNLQVTIGPDEDPYGLEMAAFLDMSYVKEDSYHKQLMVPEPKLCGNKRGTKIGKKSTVENNKTANKNALITSMFPKISLSAFRNTQNNSQVPKGAVNHEECIASGTKKVNDGHLDDSEDDDVTVIDGDFVQPTIEDNPRVEKNQFSQISNPNSQASDHLMVVIPTDKDHMKVDSVKEDRFLHSDANKQIDDNESNSFRITKLPLCGRKSPFRICSPPRTDCLLEWEGNDEPESPSEVLRAIDDWVEEKNRINLDDYSLDKPALNCLLDKKGVSSAMRMKNQMYDDDDDDDDDLPNLNFSMRNVLSTSLCNKPKTSLNREPVKMIVYAEDSDIEKNFTEDTGKEYSPTNELDILTPRKNDDEVVTSIVTEVSPILTSTYRKPLRTNLKICSSTPKVNAKRLFKMTTPEITAIEKNSLLLTEETLTPNRGEIIKESNQTNASINTSASLANKTSTLSTGDRIHLKLSRFTFAGKESDPRVESESCRDAGDANKNKEPDVVKDETCKFELYHIDPPDIGVNSAPENISSEPPVESFQRSSQRMLFQENTKSLGVCENIETSDGTYMTQNHQMNKEIEKQISKENNRLQKHASDYEGRRLVSARLNDSASNISPLKNSTKITPHADKKDCSSNFRVTQQESNLEEKIIHRSFCKDNHPNVSSQDNKSLLKNTLDKVSFDLSLDEDIFADIEMNDFDEKERNPSAADRHKESGSPSSKDYGGPINTFQPKSHKLLSVTQIIDIVDQSADETRNNKSVSESSFRMSKLSKKSPFQRKQGVSSVKLNAENKIEALANDVGTVDYKKITTSTKKKPSLLSRRASSEKLGTEACPNFSLMDEIDFDDDFQTESPNPSIPQFDLFGTGEFQPVVNDCDGNESGKQNESLKSGNLSKEPLSSVSKKDPSNSNLSNSLGELGSLTKMSSKRTPKRSSSEDDSLLNSPHSSKKVKLLKSPSSFCASQDTGYVWKRRERKACNVLGSDSEDNSFLKSNSESNSSNSVLDKRKVTTNRENISFEEDDDEDFRLDPCLPYRQSKPTEETKTKKLLKRKEKGLEFIEREAQLSCDGIVVSSDESDKEDGYANDSFVNDCTELSQDPNVDIKAIYLKSIVSPVKRVRNQHLPKVQCLSDTDEQSEEIDESEDSFVVGNDVIEYNTEYMGESMLAEDSIMQEAIRENFKCNKIGESRKSQKNKRKRIVVKDSSSEEETEEKKKLKVCEQIDKEGTEVVGSGEKQGTPDKRVNKWVNVLQSDSHEPGNLNEEITSISEKSDFGLSVSERVNIDRTSLGITPRKSLAKRLTEKKGGVSCSSYDQSKLSKSLKKSHEKDDDFILHSSEEFDTPITSDIPVKKCFVNLPRLSSITAKTPIGKSGPQNTKSLLSRTSSSNIVPSTSSQETTFTTTSSNENAKIHSQIPGLVLVDSHEVNGGGQIVSRLKLHHGLNTAVVQLGCGQYAVSTRMIISRLQLSVFTNSQNRDSLKQRVQGMLAVFERSVIIVELDKQRHGDSPYNLTHVRSKYMDTITCACAQVNQLKVLYSSGQEETSQLIWQLVEQEKKKGFNIPVLPAEIQRWQQVVNFFRSLPRISFATALCLARNFRTLHEFFNSTPEVIAKKGCMSHQRAADVHQLISRRFRADMLS